MTISDKKIVTYRLIIKTRVILMKKTMKQDFQKIVQTNTIILEERRCMNELSSNNPKSNDGIDVKWSFTEL